jgi:uncharacterized protein YcaQ
MRAMELSWNDVANWRARRHHLHERAPAGSMLRVADELCGVHAQVMSSAELTLWARVEDLAPDAVQKALWEDRTLVKTWAMRGTLHLLPGGDYGLWQSALSTGYKRFTRPSWSKAAGVQPEELAQLIETVRQALDGEPLTREELADAAVRTSGSRHLGDKLRESWGSMLKPAAVRGALCFAPSDGQKVRFTQPDAWLADHGPRPDPHEAEVEVARRYLAVHGPATREDLGRWWGVQPAPAGRLLAELGDAVTQVSVEGTPMWMQAADAADAAEAPAVGSVRLLPGFDQYVIAATRHVEQLLPGDFRPLVYRPQGWISPVLCVNGRLEGVWRHERKGKRLEVEIRPFTGRTTKRVRAAAEAEAERLAEFMGGELAVRWTDPA